MNGKIHALALRDENSDIYLLYLTKEDFDKANSDMAFAQNLLTLYKESIFKQQYNVQGTDMVKSNLLPADYVPLLLEEETTEGKVTYNLLVLKDDAAKAKDDVLFCTNLLDDHKKRYFCLYDKQNSSNFQKISNKKNSIKDSVNHKLSHYESSDEYSTPPEEDEENVEFTKKSKKKKTAKEQPCPPCVWADDEILLLSQYQKFQKSYDDGKVTNLKFWKLIMEGMKAHSNKNRIQAQTKMDSLKSMYKKTKDANNQSGNGSYSCPYYEFLDELFAKKPWIKPKSVAGSSMPFTTITENGLSGTSPSCRLAKTALHQAKLSYLEDGIKQRQLRREQKAEYNERKLKILEKLAEKLGK